MHVPAYVKAIWAGILDVKQLIREAAIESLRACLGVIAQREPAVRNKLFAIIFEEAERGLRVTVQAPEVIHGVCLSDSFKLIVRRTKVLQNLKLVVLKYYTTCSGSLLVLGELLLLPGDVVLAPQVSVFVLLYW
jgi:hypothetical protein